jgi:hypothetical protein
VDVDFDRNGVSVDTTRPSVTHREGMGASGAYQSESGSYKVIEYRPGHSR